MNKLLIILIVIATLFVAGQWYLRSRRRKASGLIERLAMTLGGALRGNRIDLVVGNHHTILDAQVTRDDRPEELRLTLVSELPGDFRLTRSDVASHYGECKHREPAEWGAPFAGWYIRFEDSGQRVALASDQRVVQLLESLADLGFARVELTKRKLRAHWPDFSWNADDHRWEGRKRKALPNRVRRAAETLSEFTVAAESALRSSGTVLIGPRIRAVFTTLLLVPVLLMAAGLVAILYLYDIYPTLSDEQLLVGMCLVAAVLSLIYTAIVYVLLRRSVQRGARTALVGILSLFGFCIGSSGPILWWNGTGFQGSALLQTVEVVKLQRVSALGSIRGRLVRELIGDDLPIVEWSTTYRAIVRSWRDDSLYGIGLSAKQFAKLDPKSGRLQLMVHPGALGLEWYSDVAVLENAEQSKERGDSAAIQTQTREIE